MIKQTHLFTHCITFDRKAGWKMKILQSWQVLIRIGHCWLFVGLYLFLMDQNTSINSHFITFWGSNQYFKKMYDVTLTDCKIFYTFRMCWDVSLLPLHPLLDQVPRADHPQREGLPPEDHLSEQSEISSDLRKKSRQVREKVVGVVFRAYFR